jgi:hypothetical protein
MIGFWLVPSSVDMAWSAVGASLLYATLAAHRRSPVLAGLAALAGNVAIWRVLSSSADLTLTRHPQLWLIPPAASLLVMGHLFSRYLAKPQLAALRYACLIVIYLSSTGDIFLNGMRQAPWLPLVLAVLSIAGILLGMWLQARSFLYTGLAFLIFSLACMLWHAAVDLQQTWVWFASGIVLGMIILAMFAMFERQRSRLQAWTRSLDRWEP